MIALTFENAPVLRPEGWDDAPLGVAGGRITEATGRRIDLSGYAVRPGIVDIHGDGFERHVAPRRGALRDMPGAITALAAELAANGITTAVVAQFWSWEGGMRGPDFAERVFAAVRTAAPALPVDLHLQMRLETHFTEAFATAETALARHAIRYVVFNDHLQHDRLATGKTPKRLTGQALKSGRNPEDHLALMQRLHDAGDRVPAALDALCARLCAAGIRLGSHDDATADARAAWAARGATIAEFPETEAAAKAARSHGAGIVLGAPNVVRGASHAGKVAAEALVAAGLCDALASDYHYPAPAHAAAKLAPQVGDAAAWALVSEGPARLLGLEDRGRITPGLRADLVIEDSATGRICATLSAGRIAYLTAPLAERFL